jgi:hypothetical protein
MDEYQLLSTCILKCLDVGRYREWVKTLKEEELEDLEWIFSDNIANAEPKGHLLSPILDELNNRRKKSKRWQ